MLLDIEEDMHEDRRAFSDLKNRTGFSALGGSPATSQRISQWPKQTEALWFAFPLKRFSFISSLSLVMDNN